MSEAPLIVTLRIDEESQSMFNELRKEYFPAHLNFLDAHLTLFHKLPSNMPAVTDLLRHFSSRPSFAMRSNGLKNIGNGVAIEVISNELIDMHRDMQQALEPWLINQDRQKLWPHITIQNKVTAFKAMQSLEKLSDTYADREIRAIGLTSWLYLKGPWERSADFNFFV